MSTFEALLQEAPRGGAYVVVPPEVVADLGGGGRIPVVANFDGIEYRGSVVRMGGESILGVLKAIRERLGKSLGDSVGVRVEKDLAERDVDLPEELVAALTENPGVRQAFDALSYSHRREHALYVAEAKKPATRVRRARTTVERLVGGG